MSRMIQIEYMLLHYKNYHYTMPESWSACLYAHSWAVTGTGKSCSPDL